MTVRWTRLGAVSMLLVFGVAVPHGLHAQPTPRLQNIQRAQVTYVLSSDLIEPLTVQARGRDGTDFSVGFDPGGSGSYEDRTASGPTGDQIRYQLYRTSATQEVLKDLVGAPDGSGLLSGTIGINDILSFDLVVFGGQPVPAGRYEDAVTATLYGGLDGAGGVLDSKTLDLIINVDASVAVAVVPTGSPFNSAAEAATVDFGAIESGVQRTVDVIVQANTGYTLGLSSVHAGVLTHTDPVELGTIPYQLTVDGVPITLATTEVPIGSGLATSLDGVAYGLVFTAGDSTGASDGLYQDSLTVTVTAQ